MNANMAVVWNHQKSFLSLSSSSSSARLGLTIGQEYYGRRVKCCTKEQHEVGLKQTKIPEYECTSLPPPTPYALLGRFYRLSTVDQVFVVLGFMSCLTVGALLSALVTAIPTLKAVNRAAVSLEKLSEMARQELPGTMAAIRLSTMEISDLTLELNDLSQEISDGVRSSARAVEAAEVGIRRMGAVAASQTFAMLQEGATLPVEVVKPVVVNAANSTRIAVANARKALLSFWNNNRHKQEE